MIKTIHSQAVLVVLIALAASTAMPSTSLAAGPLVKSRGNSAVYYIDEQSVRHAFPNALTYRSWYGNDFSGVTVASDNELGGYPLGKNITLKPGKWLVKVPSAPTVYAVESGGTLRPIASAEVADAIWGAGWRKKVVDLSEVFFENYQVGEPLTRTYELPSSIVYRVKGEPTYYWKQDVLLQPFTNWAAAAANGYAPEDVVTSGRTLPVRQRPIAGRSPIITNPLAAPRQTTQDCGGPGISAALILVTRGQLDAAAAFTWQQVRERLPNAYAWATRELGELVVREAAVLPDDGWLTAATPIGGRKITSEASLTFYDEHPDTFDFLIIFTNFTLQQDEPNHEADHFLVTNAILGLGLPRQQAAALFGSQGKLKGMIVVGDLSRFDLTTPTGQEQFDNLLLHEFAHQWSGAVKFRVGPEQDSVALLRDDGRHWSHYVGWLSPLGGAGWRNNGDGTFNSRLTSQAESVARPYSDLDLYLMGLLPAQAVSPFFYVEPAVPGLLSNTIKGVPQTVTVDQVIAANGKRRCELGR